jgi:hypothetical protein
MIMCSSLQSFAQLVRGVDVILEGTAGWALIAPILPRALDSCLLERSHVS